jgi:hypothetical protein
VTCVNSAALAVDTSTSYTLTVAVGAGAATSVNHAVSVSVAGDLNAANDSATDATLVAPAPVPAFTFFPSVLAPGQQAILAVTIPSPFPHDITGSVSLAFASNAVVPLDDPAVQFATGGRSVSFTIPANATQARFGSATSVGPVGFQAGTVAGSLSFSGTYAAGTVQGAIPDAGKSVPLQPPVIRELTRDGGGVSILLYSTTREVTELSMTFNTSPQVRLSCGGTPRCSVSGNTVVFNIEALFAAWFQNDTMHGGLGLLRVPFAIQGEIGGSVVVSLKNSRGHSQPAVFSLP